MHRADSLAPVGILRGQRVCDGKRSRLKPVGKLSITSSVWTCALALALQPSRGDGAHLLRRAAPQAATFTFTHDGSPAYLAARVLGDEIIHVALADNAKRVCAERNNSMNT